MKKTIIPQQQTIQKEKPSYKKNQSRLSLYGKQVDKKTIALEVLRLRKGDAEKNIKALSWSQIATVLGFTKSRNIYNYRDYIRDNKLAELDDKGNIIAPTIPKFTNFETFDKKHSIIHHPIVDEWRKNLMVRKQGKPLGGMNQYIRNVEVVCNTLKINPEQLLIGLKESEKYLENFLILYQEGKATMTYNYQLGQVDMTNIAYTFSKGIRDLMNLHGLRYPKGTTGVMSQKVPNHAKYGGVRLTNEELEIADSWLVENYGIDSDVYRAFWIGVESCSRNKALFGMKLTYTKHVSKKGKITYIMEAYESKTQHIEGGIWIKYITRSQTQKSIDLLRDRGGTKIYDDTKLINPTKQKITDIENNIKESLFDLYVHLGKIENLQEFKDLKSQKLKVNNYWFNHAFHVLRHVGAHYWLKKKSYNHSLVAELGGWHTIDELKRSYGKMPPEVVLELLEDEEMMS